MFSAVEPGASSVGEAEMKNNFSKFSKANFKKGETPISCGAIFVNTYQQFKGRSQEMDKKLRKLKVKFKKER